LNGEATCNFQNLFGDQCLRGFSIIEQFAELPDPIFSLKDEWGILGHLYFVLCFILVMFCMVSTKGQRKRSLEIP
jgi:hypothetical protein